jgi:hypothetical protein
LFPYRLSRGHFLSRALGKWARNIPRPFSEHATFVGGIQSLKEKVLDPYPGLLFEVAPYIWDLGEKGNC